MKNTLPPSIKQSLPIVFGIVFGSILTVGISTISAQSMDTINGCIRPVTGLLRILGDNQTCGQNEIPLSWTQNGGNGIGSFGGYTTNQLVGYDGTFEHMYYRNFEGANFTDAVFREESQYSNFSNVNFTNATIGSSFADCDFSNSTFAGTRISNSVINSNFTNASFTNADLTASDFTNTNLTNATWSNTICPDGTNSDNNGNTCEGHLVP